MDVNEDLNRNFDTLWTRNPKMGAMANSEEPDVMPYDAAFHQDLRCLQRQNRSSEKEI